ncbi:MAG: hypothetical protein LBM69_10700 [Lachnospiraceae bacterium]|jgi:hypothetical protein|nr:hypothetical protein [Lachnospiraceae bacterium]
MEYQQLFAFAMRQKARIYEKCGEYHANATSLSPTAAHPNLKTNKIEKSVFNVLVKMISSHPKPSKALQVLRRMQPTDLSTSKKDEMRFLGVKVSQLQILAEALFKTHDTGAWLPKKHFESWNEQDYHAYIEICYKMYIVGKQYQTPNLTAPSRYGSTGIN